MASSSAGCCSVNGYFVCIKSRRLRLRVWPSSVLTMYERGVWWFLITVAFVDQFALVDGLQCWYMGSVDPFSKVGNSLAC